MLERMAHLLNAIESILFESFVIERHLRLSRNVERFPGIGPPPGEDNVKSILLCCHLPSRVIRIFLPWVKEVMFKEVGRWVGRSSDRSVGRSVFKICSIPDTSNKLANRKDAQLNLT